MNYLGSFYAFLTAIGFETNNLTVRFLQEKGAAKLDTYVIYRYALIPALIWSLIFIHGSDLRQIFHTPELLIIFGAIVVFWNLQGYLRAKVLNSTNSMVLFSTMLNVLLFPLFLAFGTFFNHDRPNLFSLSAIGVLLVALLIRPTPHKKNVRPSLAMPLPAIALLVFFIACCDAILQGVAREALKQVRPVVFLGAFSVPTLSVCWIISRFYVQRRITGAAVKATKAWWAVGLIPLTWFVASIPEAFSLAAIPIYVFISINVVTFLMDTASDIIYKRIHLGIQTISFIVLVLVGISLSVLSV